MDFQYLKQELKDGVALVTINRPESLNALNSQLLSEIGEMFNARQG